MRRKLGAVSCLESGLDFTPGFRILKGNILGALESGREIEPGFRAGNFAHFLLKTGTVRGVICAGPSHPFGYEPTLHFDPTQVDPTRPRSRPTAIHPHRAAQHGLPMRRRRLARGLLAPRRRGRDGLRTGKYSG